MASDDAKQYPTIEDFLMARYEEEERWTRSPDFNVLVRPGLTNHIRAHRSIVEWHSRWPVMVTGETKFYPPAFELHRSPMEIARIQMTQQVDFLTSQQYRERFGEEPPTAPILKMLAAVYATHPDYNPEWSN